MHACTTITRSHLAFARVLARTFLQHHPGSTFHALILDPVPGGGDREPFEALEPGDFLSPEEFGPLWLAYTPLELACAVKPRLLGHLLDRFGEGAVYLDADIRVYRPMDWLEGLLAEHAVVLTPHNLHPVPDDGRTPTELFIHRSGAYNAGFVGVGPEARPFLEWWWQRLERRCLAAPERGLFVDQRWLDAAPGLFDCHVLKEVTVNVAYWNLASRRVTASAEGYLVNGEPLTFFHFSGYNPQRPWLLSRHAGLAPRALLSESPALRRLCDEYRSALLEAGYTEASRVPFDQHTLPGGLVLDERARRLYREAVTPVETSARRAGVPSPLTDPAGLVAWLREPEDPAHPAWLSRYLWRLYGDRRGLRERFPEVPGASEEGFRAWVLRHGRDGAGIPEGLLPAPELPSPAGLSPRPAGPGVNLVGYFRSELGLGEAARQVVGAVAALGLPLATLTLPTVQARQEHPFDERQPVPGLANPYDLNLVCLNPPGLIRFAGQARPDFFAGRYTVGYWAWEMEEFPDAWPQAFGIVDEIWMNSEHAATGVRGLTDKPVEVFPVPVEVPAPAALPRRALGLPDAFLFLFMFDYGSVPERKNPLGLVRAFQQAFAPGEGPVLVIKSINEAAYPTKREQLRYEAADRPDIVFLEGYLAAGHKDALIAACDCYVSLHRAEGFGLTMAEAMALGKPTIATGYSGNLEFMTRENSYLVGWSEATVPADCRPYREGNKWAEPDLDEAAALLRRVYENPGEARRVGEVARADLERLHGPAARARLLERLLGQIRAERMPGNPGGIARPGIAVAWAPRGGSMADDSEAPVTAEARAEGTPGRARESEALRTRLKEVTARLDRTRRERDEYRSQLDRLKTGTSAPAGAPAPPNKVLVDQEAHEELRQAKRDLVRLLRRLGRPPMGWVLRRQKGYRRLRQRWLREG